MNKPHWLPICPVMLVYSYKFNSILKQMYSFICRYACLRPGMYQSIRTSNLSLKPRPIQEAGTDMERLQIIASVL
jgi:hypothetical protein